MAAAVQSLAAGSCHEPFARGFIQALLWRWSRCSCRVFMSTQSQWVLLCGLRVALLACEDGHGESPFPDLCAVESGVGIQWKSAVRAPGSCSCPWFAVTRLAKSLSLQSKLGSAGRDGEFRCSAALQPLCISRALIHPW